jgi:NAD(P)-dependent dehydrogenase (short-subunit alcohol dehydrogenase family)
VSINTDALTDMKKTRSAAMPLKGRVALVAGATRGAGRGIARALGEAGATVYCTGRSVKGKPSAYGRPETIDETAAMINAAGGDAIAVRVDHTNEAEVKALFRRIIRARQRIDIVVDSVAGEDPLMGSYGFLWQADLTTAEAIFRQGLTSRIITAKHAALAMMPARRGLIVEVTEADMIGGGGTPMAQAVKMAQKVLPLLWAAELAPHGITVMAVTPGFLRSESMLQRFGVTEETCREAGKKDPNFLQSESPLFVGRAMAALAPDPKVQARLCAEFGISRKTGYKIFERYKECGVQAFTDRSHRPYRQANRRACAGRSLHGSDGARRRRHRQDVGGTLPVHRTAAALAGTRSRPQDRRSGPRSEGRLLSSRRGDSHARRKDRRLHRDRGRRERLLQPAAQRPGSLCPCVCDRLTSE